MTSPHDIHVLQSTTYIHRYIYISIKSYPPLPMNEFLDHGIPSFLPRSSLPRSIHPSCVVLLWTGRGRETRHRRRTGCCTSLLYGTWTSVSRCAVVVVDCLVVFRDMHIGVSDGLQLGPLNQGIDRRHTLTPPDDRGHRLKSPPAWPSGIV